MVLFYPLKEVTREGSAFVFLLYLVQVAAMVIVGTLAFAWGLRRFQLAPR
jgi:hypothetical protein